MTARSTRAVAWELSVACARRAAGLDDGAEVARIAGDVRDWEAVVSLVREQALLPWLARALEEGRFAAADAVVRAARGDDVARTLAQVRQLVELTQAFAEAGIPVLPYKGPALSLQLYGDVALRHSSDLDLVVSRRDYLRARQLLLAHGLPPRGGHSLAQERALFAWLGHASFGAEHEDFVELHWRFAPRQFPFGLTPETAIARSTRVAVAGQSMRLMARDDLLVTLAMHGTRHLYERLEWLAGVALLLRTATHDPPALLRLASALHGKRMLLASVVVAHRVLGLPLDAAWRSALTAEAEAWTVGDEIADLAIAQGRDGVALPDGATLQTLYTRLIDSRLDRVRSLLRAALMPTEREWELVRLPDPLTPLYRVVRPARVAMIYARRLFGGPMGRS